MLVALLSLAVFVTPSLAPSLAGAAPVEAPEVLAEVDGDTPGWQATFVVHADADAVLAAVADQPRNSKALSPSVKSLKVLGPTTSGTWQTAFTVEGAGEMNYISNNVLKKSPGGGGSLSWSRASGDFKVVEGSWVIAPLPEAGWSHVTYTVRVAMGPGFMQGFVRDGVKKSSTGIAGRLRAVMARQPKAAAPAEPTPSATTTTPTTP